MRELIGKSVKHRVVDRNALTSWHVNGARHLYGHMRQSSRYDRLSVRVSFRVVAVGKMDRCMRLDCLGAVFPMPLSVFTNRGTENRLV
jgi:hypothetical protein